MDGNTNGSAASDLCLIGSEDSSVTVRLLIAIVLIPQALLYKEMPPPMTGMVRPADAPRWVTFRLCSAIGPLGCSFKRLRWGEPRTKGL